MSRPALPGARRDHQPYLLSRKVGEGGRRDDRRSGADREDTHVLCAKANCRIDESARGIGAVTGNLQCGDGLMSGCGAEAATGPDAAQICGNNARATRLSSHDVELRRRMDMDWNRIEGNWKQLKGKVKEQWGKLTDDDLDVIEGKRAQLEGKIQERYGYGKDQVRKEVDDWY